MDLINGKILLEEMQQLVQFRHFCVRVAQGYDSCPLILWSAVRIHSQLSFTQSEEIRQLSVIPGVEITRCGHIERKDVNTAR